MRRAVEKSKALNVPIRIAPYGRRPLRRRAARGLTLLELLVSLSISTLIVGASASVFVTTLHSWERGSQRYKILQIAQSTGDLIERNLRSAVSPATGRDVLFWGIDLSDGETPGHQIIMRSSAIGRIPRSQPMVDSSEIEFYFDPGDGGGFQMRIDSSPDEYPDQGGYNISLSPLIQSFKVNYFDGEEWLENWVEDSLPLSVEFRFTVSDPKDVSPVTGQPSVYEFSRLVTMPAARSGGTEFSLEVAF